MAILCKHNTQTFLYSMPFRHCQVPVGELNRNKQHFKTIKPYKTAKNKQNLEMQNTHCFRLFDIANEKKNTFWTPIKQGNNDRNKL